MGSGGGRKAEAIRKVIEDAPIGMPMHVDVRAAVPKRAALEVTGSSGIFSP